MQPSRAHPQEAAAAVDASEDQEGWLYLGTFSLDLYHKRKNKSSCSKPYKPLNPKYKPA